MNKAIIVGGGIIGLASAYYLQKSGWKVTVIDKDDFTDNCSFGNAGYVCPSHYIPLATPGIVKQGLKWMLNSQSPFYIQPRLNSGLIDWGFKFMRSATQQHVDQAGVPLRDIALYSQHEYEQVWSKEMDFAYEHKGMLEIFQTQANAEHAHHTVQKGKDLGLDVELLNYAQLQALEPAAKINALGAIYFKCDGHLYPNKLMTVLKAKLEQSGVIFVGNEMVTGFEKKDRYVTKVITAKTAREAQYVIIATGSWSREVAALLDVKIPLVGGRGYSFTIENFPFKIEHPAVLVEGRSALTPMEDGHRLRFGGTMEITSLDTPPRMNRVAGIVKSVNDFFPDFHLAVPTANEVWYGFRPCSADGLPYIGKLSGWKNVVVATGHSMLGLSLGPATGKLVDELVNERPTGVDLKPFAVERFS
jgi:D-amino-acid dehydrogenase